MNAPYDEGRVRRGTHGWVHFLGNYVEVIVQEMRVNPKDGRLYADCADSSGECRWVYVDEVLTDRPSP